MSNEDNFIIASIGRQVGLNGEFKLNIFSDFTDQFKKDAKFSTSKGELEIEYYLAKSSKIKFKNINVNDSHLVNAKIYSNINETRQKCLLKKDEFFYFDIISCVVVENEEKLGEVKDIQKIGNTDYFHIKTFEKFSHFSKNLMLPYIDKYIEKVDVKEKKIFSKNALILLESLK